MTRQDYIFHLDTLRKGLLELIAFDAKTRKRLGSLTMPEQLEEERAKKTAKMFDDLAVRLYEDGAVSERVKQEKILNGDLEQAEITFPPDIDNPTVAHRKGGAK